MIILTKNQNILSYPARNYICFLRITVIISKKQKIFVVQRSMRSACAEIWKALSKNKPKSVFKTQERNYPWKGYRIDKNAVDLNGNPLEDNLTNKSNRIFLTEENSNKIEAALTQVEQSGIIDNKPIVRGEERSSGQTQYVAKVLDEFEILDPQAVSLESKCQPFLDKMDDKITQAVNELHQEIKDANIVTKTISIVHKNNLEKFKNERQNISNENQ